MPILENPGAGAGVCASHGDDVATTIAAIAARAGRSEEAIAQGMRRCTMGNPRGMYKTGELTSIVRVPDAIAHFKAHVSNSGKVSHS